MPITTDWYGEPGHIILQVVSGLYTMTDVHASFACTEQLAVAAGTMDVDFIIDMREAGGMPLGALNFFNWMRRGNYPPGSLTVVIGGPTFLLTLIELARRAGFQIFTAESIEAAADLIYQRRGLRG